LQPTNQKMLKIQYSEDKSEKREILFGLTRWRENQKHGKKAAQRGS
jgi:hypothetical protein